jgi:hypothetical protein
MNVLTSTTARNLCRISLLVAVTALSGCGSSSNAHQPAASAARAALDSALSAWKNGEGPDTLASKSPSVQAVDSHWRAGQKLTSYEVVKEEPGEGDQRFTVRLAEDDPKNKAKSSASTKEVTYVVIGRDPIWVYRDEDYTRLLNMDNNPQPARKAGGAAPRPGSRFQCPGSC